MGCGAQGVAGGSRQRRDRVENAVRNARWLEQSLLTLCRVAAFYQTVRSVASEVPAHLKTRAANRLGSQGPFGAQIILVERREPRV